MAELNIPMRTKASMDLGMVFAQGGEERILPAMDLQNVQNGMGSKSVNYRPPQSQEHPGTAGGGFSSVQRSSVQNPSGRTQGSPPARQNSPLQAANSRREALRREVRHYEVRSEGGIVLNKGGKASFSSLYPGRLGQIEVEMGWDAEGFSADDVDASCFMLGENGKAIGDEWFVFYNQPFSPDRSIMHEGKRGGEKKEKIVVDFSRLGLKVKRLAFVLTINEAREHGQSFSQVGNAHVRIRDKASRKELALFNLSDYYEGVTAMTVCEFYEYHGEWKINPVGHGLKDTGLLELCRFYGVRVE